MVVLTLEGVPLLVERTEVLVSEEAGALWAGTVEGRLIIPPTVSSGRQQVRNAMEGLRSPPLPLQIQAVCRSGAAEGGSWSGKEGHSLWSAT